LDLQRNTTAWSETSFREFMAFLDGIFFFVGVVTVRCANPFHHITSLCKNKNH